MQGRTLPVINANAILAAAAFTTQSINAVAEEFAQVSVIRLCLHPAACLYPAAEPHQGLVIVDQTA